MTWCTVVFRFEGPRRRAIGCPDDLTLSFGRDRRISNLGPLSIVLREEPTARQALDTLGRYLRLLNASLLTQIEDHGDLVIVREEVLIDGPGSIRQSIELAVGVMHRILVELLGPAWKPRRVCFAHRAPADLTSHRALFGAELEFNSSFNGIVCAAKDLTARLLSCVYAEVEVMAIAPHSVRQPWRQRGCVGRCSQALGRILEEWLSVRPPARP
jgi:hypothetical protein